MLSLEVQYRCSEYQVKSYIKNVKKQEFFKKEERFVVESYPSNAPDKLDNMLLSNHGVLPHLKGNDMVRGGSINDAIDAIA